MAPVVRSEGGDSDSSILPDASVRSVATVATRKRRKGKPQSVDELRAPELKHQVTSTARLKRKNAELCSQNAELTTKVAKLTEELSAPRKEEQKNSCQITASRGGGKRLRESTNGLH